MSSTTGSGFGMPGTGRPWPARIFTTSGAKMSLPWKVDGTSPLRSPGDLPDLIRRVEEGEDPVVRSDKHLIFLPHGEDSPSGADARVDHNQVHRARRKEPEAGGKEPSC
jgi:hypothetical protein